MPDEITLQLSPLPLPPAAQRLIDAGVERAKEIRWFDFVASDYAVVGTVLTALARGRFCEWGSGMGIVTALAEMLGYDALGIEIHEPLAKASRELLAQFGLKSPIEVGDIFARTDQADLYFAYCWPGKVTATQDHFFKVAPAGARLLIYYGPADIRWLAK